MTSPTGGPRGLEPSAEGVAALRSQLQQLGFLIRIDSAHEILRAVLAVEAARIDRHAHEAAAECLRSIQSAAREALHILTEGALTEGAPADTTNVSAARASAPGAPRRPPAPPTPPEEKPISIAEVVRRRLGEEMPSDNRPPRPDTRVSASPPPPPPPPLGRAPIAEPRRPVIRHPRKR